MSRVHVYLLQKQVNLVNKVVTSVMDIVSRAREEWESDASCRTGTPQTSSPSDTTTLLQAIGMGKGLKMIPGRPGPPPNQMTTSQQQGQQSKCFTHFKKSVSSKHSVIYIQTGLIASVCVH